MIYLVIGFVVLVGFFLLANWACRDSDLLFEHEELDSWYQAKQKETDETKVLQSEGRGKKAHS